MKEKNKSVILCFDEFRKFVSSGNKNFDNGVTDEFKTQLGGIEDLIYKNDGEIYKIFSIATTNNIEDIDDGIKRAGRSVVLHIDLPNKKERINLFKLAMKGKKRVKIDYNKLGELTENMSGADIKEGIVGGTLSNLLIKNVLDGEELTEKNIHKLEGINPKKDERMWITQDYLEEAIKAYSKEEEEREEGMEVA